MLLPLARMSSFKLLAPGVTFTGGSGLVAGPTLGVGPGSPCIWSPLLRITVRLIVYSPLCTQNVVALVAKSPFTMSSRSPLGSFGNTWIILVPEQVWLALDGEV